MVVDPTQSVVLFRGSSNTCIVRVLSGPDAGREVVLGDEPVLVGRSSHAQLQLTDSTVSDRHAVLRVVRIGIEVEDLSSTNGTHYLGTRLERAVVNPGVTLQFGSCRVALVPVEGDGPVAASERPCYGSILGESQPMRELFSVLERIEAVDYPVLLLGETGVGKELFAREIHEHSSRSKHRLVVCDCAALSPSLAESELFGHVKGAFTDARDDRRGLFVEADRGTVFLDEVGELPLELQPKLLRVLENLEVRPVGASTTRRVDIRVIAATNRDLEREVAAGRFRQDLLFRLNPVTLRIPPLRERSGDVPLLVEHLLRELGRGEVTFSPETVALFSTTYSWPGNVRELRNTIMQVQALGALPEPLERARTGPSSGRPSRTADSFKQAKDKVVAAFERDYLATKLAENDGVVSAAARSAGLDRSRFRRLLKKHGLHD